MSTRLAKTSGIRLGFQDGWRSNMAEINCWLAHSLERVFPASPSRAASTIELAAARNERVSFQVCVRNSGTKPVTLKARVDAAGLEIGRASCRERV